MTEEPNNIPKEENTLTQKRKYFIFDVEMVEATLKKARQQYKHAMFKAQRAPLGKMIDNLVFISSGMVAELTVLPPDKEVPYTPPEPETLPEVKTEEVPNEEDRTTSP